MAKSKAVSAPIRGAVCNASSSAGVRLTPQSQATLRGLRVIREALEDIKKLKEQHTQQGRALFRLREQLVLAEDTYLEQERVLDELSTLLFNESDVPRVGLSEHGHAEPKEKNRRHATDAPIATPLERNEVRGNTAETSDHGDHDVSEGPFSAWARGDQTKRKRRTLPWVENGSAHAPIIGEAVDPKVIARGRIEENSSVLAETWESYASNVGSPQQPIPIKRKQTARRSQPHFSRLNLMSSRKPNAEAPTPMTPKGDLLNTTAAAFSDVNFQAQKCQRGEDTDSQPESRSVHAVQQEIDSLPQPPKMSIPKDPRKFSNTLLTSSLGGNASTFAKVGPAMLGKQVFKCPELIKVNPEVHDYAPLTGQHGALTLVDGQEGSGELGKVYPLFRKNMNRWEYAGEYRVARRIELPVATWNQWPNETRQAIATRIDRTGWGQKLLLEKGLAKDEDELHSLQIKHILEFFEKPDTPHLRMSWTLLQCVGYVREKHDTLATKQDEEPKPRPTSRTSLNRDIPIDWPKSHLKRMAQRQSATPNIDPPIAKKRRARQGIATSDSEDNISSGKRLCQNDRNSNQRTASFVEEHTDEDIATASSPPTSPYGNRQRTAEYAIRGLNSVPLEELDEEHVQYSSRGRRTRKDIDYRIMNPDLDDMIFRDHFSDEQG